MEDVLAILMVAFGLFATLMFVLFYIYAKKTHNTKNMSEDYNVDDNEDVIVNPEPATTPDAAVVEEATQKVEETSNVSQEVTVPISEENTNSEVVTLEPQQVAETEEDLVMPSENNFETIMPNIEQEEVSAPVVQEVSVSEEDNLQKEESPVENDLESFIPKKKKI